MSLASVQFLSDALGKRVSYNVILPDEGEGPFPVLFQLHGLSDDCNAWIQKSNLVRHVEEFPFVVVLPDGGTSAYLNWKGSDRLNKHRYEDLIVTDIAGHVRRQFNVTDGPWAIGGLSMGGYGAMFLGLKHPGMFASIWAHSSAFHIDQIVDPELVEDLADANIFAHAERVARMDTKPTIAFDCGVDDERLIDHNRELHAFMDTIGLEHHFAEHPGGHTWPYWDEHVQEALVQHARVLGIEPARE